jgi:hypothetical protein
VVLALSQRARPTRSSAWCRPSVGWGPR